MTDLARRSYGDRTLTYDLEGEPPVLSHLSLSQVASRLGVSEATVRRWRRGQNTPAGFPQPHGRYWHGWELDRWQDTFRTGAMA